MFIEKNIEEIFTNDNVMLHVKLILNSYVFKKKNLHMYVLL